MNSYFKEKTRLPTNAGYFYPESKEELEKIIRDYLEKVTVPQIEGKIFGILVPHAGYQFSGFVAAHAYKSLEGGEFKSVILIGDSHYERFDGVSIWERGEWETPLGKVKVNEKIAREILGKSKRFFVRDSAHLFEHSLEVQLPFLQIVLRNFEIVPIIFGSEDKDWSILGNLISEIMKKDKILVVASSDLSHYPSYEIAQRLDSETINSILTLDPEKFKEKTRELEEKYPEVDTSACAQDSIKTILKITKNLKGKATLLKYQNSGDSFLGDKSRVVGYSAIAFHF